MKNILYNLTILLFIFAVTSCEKVEDTVINKEETIKKSVTLNVGINNNTTKISLGEKDGTGSYSMLWSNGDEIAVINNGRLFKFTINAEDAGKQSATFTCEDGYYFDESKEIIAYYPYEAVSYSYGQIYCNVPYQQIYTTSSFDKSAFHMAAKRASGNSGPLSFNYLFGIIKLKINGGNLDKLVGTIKIGSSSPLSHSSSTLNTNTLKVEIPQTGFYNSELKCNESSNGISINNSTDFIIVVPAGEQILGFLINTYETNGSFNKGYYRRTTSYKNITAGRILTLPEINLSNATTRSHMEVQNWSSRKYSHSSNVFYSSYVYGRMIGYTLWADTNVDSSVSNEYESSNYPGNLFQWGRKDGMYLAEVVSGPFNLENGEPDPNKYYSKYGFDWCTPSYDQMWNTNTGDDKEINPTKSETDPCPNGWRVPTATEFNNLFGNYISNVDYQEFWDDSNPGYFIQQGYEFSGKTDYDLAKSKNHTVTLPYGGFYGYQSSVEGPTIIPENLSRFRDGAYYWTSSVNGEMALGATFTIPEGANAIDPIIKQHHRAQARQIRCVKE